MIDIFFSADLALAEQPRCLSGLATEHKLLFKLTVKISLTGYIQS